MTNKLSVRNSASRADSQRAVNSPPFMRRLPFLPRAEEIAAERPALRPPSRRRAPERGPGAPQGRPSLSPSPLAFPVCHLVLREISTAAPDLMHTAKLREEEKKNQLREKKERKEPERLRQRSAPRGSPLLLVAVGMEGRGRAVRTNRERSGVCQRDSARRMDFSVKKPTLLAALKATGAAAERIRCRDSVRAGDAERLRDGWSAPVALCLHIALREGGGSGRERSGAPAPRSWPKGGAVAEPTPPHHNPPPPKDAFLFDVHSL